MATWPDNPTFAFTVFDDPDSQTCQAIECRKYVQAHMNRGDGDGAYNL